MSFEDDCTPPEIVSQTSSSGSLGGPGLSMGDEHMTPRTLEYQRVSITGDDTSGVCYYNMCCSIINLIIEVKFNWL